MRSGVGLFARRQPNQSLLFALGQLLLPLRLRCAAFIVPDRNRRGVVSGKSPLRGVDNGRMQDLVLIIDRPLRIGGEREEARFELAKFALFFGAARGFDQFGVLRRFRTILLGREHERAFL